MVLHERRGTGLNAGRCAVLSFTSIDGPGYTAPALATHNNNLRPGKALKIDAWLAELKIPRENYRLVMMLPMVYVAWADGRIQAAERKLILQIAEDRGLLESGGRETLEQWLSVAPSTARLQTDLAILNELCSSHSKTDDDFDADCSQLLVAYCQDVADAAGGMLGLKSARNESEQAALKLIATALDIKSARNWRARLS
jgi:hypothetical protein